MELVKVSAKITISDGEALGKSVKCFNLPNNNCGVIKTKHKIELCENGAGRKATKCEKCKYSCKKIVLCSGATMICNNRCYQNNALTLENRKVVYGNYLSSVQKDFVSKMESEIQKCVDEEKLKYFRIHSLGEFYSYRYFCKWMKIAQKFSGQVTFVAYTKCYKMLDQYIKRNGSIPNNVKIMLSIMPDSLYGTKYEIEKYKHDEKSLQKKKKKNIKLIKSLLKQSNTDVYLTTYDDVCKKILKDNRVDWLPGLTVQECLLHCPEKTCTDCIQDNSNKGGCYVLEDIKTRNRIIVEKIRVTTGRADYRYDLKKIGEHNLVLAEILEREINE